MRNEVLKLSLVAQIVLLSAGCLNDDGKAVKQQTLSEIDRIEVAPKRHCFRNEYPFNEQPTQKDILELFIEIDGEHAIGEYNWLPVYKDKRLGRFDGSIHDESITAKYKFEQEGEITVAMILISLEKERAVVEGGTPNLGLNATIARIDC